jgi:hypothetical protein
MQRLIAASPPFLLQPFFEAPCRTRVDAFQLPEGFL